MFMFPKRNMQIAWSWEMQERLAVHSLCFLTHFISGYRLFNYILFLVGSLVPFTYMYVLCTCNKYLTDQLSGKALEYKHQVLLNIICLSNFQEYLTERARFIILSVKEQWSGGIKSHLEFTVVFLSFFGRMVSGGNDITRHTSGLNGVRRFNL